MKKNATDVEVGRQEYWEVYGTSRKGNVTKRNGKPISCGHQHPTREDAAACQQKFRAERPGHCQDYRPLHLVLIKYRRHAQRRKTP